MNLIYVANEIKNALDTSIVFERYGFAPDKKGFVCCPFHHEKTPSMKVYPNNRGYHCFGCGEHGGVIDFVMKHFNLSFKESIQKLNEDFSLGILSESSFDRRKKMDIARRSFKAKQEMEQKKKEEKLKKKNYYDALDYWIILDNNKRKYKPSNENDELHPLFVESIMNISKAEHRLDCAEVELYLYETRNR